MKPKVFIVSVIFFLLTCFAKCQTVATQQDKKDTLAKPSQVERLDTLLQIGCYERVPISDIFYSVAGTYEFNTTYKSTIYRDDLEHMAK